MNLRRTLMEVLIGKENADDLEKGLTEVQAANDAAGIERKALDAEKYKGIIEELRNDFAKPLDRIRGDIDDALRQEVVNEMIALTVGRLMQAPQSDVAEEVVEETEMAEGDEDAMIDDEVVEEEMMGDDMKAIVKQLTEDRESIKALAKESNDVLKDAGELIPALVEGFGVIKELKPVIALVGQAEKAIKLIEAMDERMKALEERVNAAPRQASLAAQTLVQPDSKIAKAVTEKQNTEKVAQSPIFGDMFTE